MRRTVIFCSLAIIGLLALMATGAGAIGEPDRHENFAISFSCTANDWIDGQVGRGNQLPHNSSWDLCESTHLGPAAIQNTGPLNARVAFCLSRRGNLLGGGGKRGRWCTPRAMALPHAGSVWPSGDPRDRRYAFFTCIPNGSYEITWYVDLTPDKDHFVGRPVGSSHFGVLRLGPGTCKTFKYSDAWYRWPSSLPRS